MTLRRVLFVSVTAVAISFGALFLPGAITALVLLVAGWSHVLGWLLIGGVAGVVGWLLIANAHRLHAHQQHQERNPYPVPADIAEWRKKHWMDGAA